MIELVSSLACLPVRRLHPSLAPSLAPGPARAVETIGGRMPAASRGAI